jgi:hypothetical protein
MSIAKRLSADRKLVSHFDKAFVEIPRDRIREYTKTLDIKDLGDLSQYNDPPTVFTVKALRVDHEAFFDLSYDEFGKADWGETNYWAVFRGHVTNATDLDLEIKDGYVGNNLREIIPPNVYEDIARKIYAIANNGEEVFHMPPVGFMAYIQNLLIGPAENANTAAAETKD